jgi:hypothetical protein
LPAERSEAVSEPHWAGVLAGRSALALVLARRHHRHRQRQRTSASGRPGRWRTALATVLATGGPAVAVVAAWRSGARFRRPLPAREIAFTAAYATVTAAAEELLWRAPLLRIARGPRRLAATLLAGGAFVGLHLPRDGRAGLPVHALNAASWSVATVVGCRLRWAIAAHAAYDAAARTLRPREVSR